MENRTYNRYAEFKAGLNNKFYEVEVQEQDENHARWTHRWGRIGTTGQTKSGMSLSFESAKRHCDEQFEKKLAKGYREVTAMQILASAAQDVSDRPVRGLQPIDIVIPDFGAGPSEKRCREFARKFIDKMNLIRKSKDDLGSAYHDQMADLVDSCVKEWERIRESKTHGLNIGSKAHEGYRVVLEALTNYGVRAKVNA